MAANGLSSEKCSMSKLIAEEDVATDDGKPCRVDLSSQELETFALKSNNSIGWNLVSDLDLAFNHLSILPTEFSSHIPSLQSLDISGNIFESLPEVIGELPCITSLRADECCTRNLPSTLRDLKRLEYLSLVGNSLSSLDNDFCFPVNLETLLLDECELKILPESICSLHKLTVLEASRNYLSRLPLNFGKICNLEVINLSHNELVSLPDTFGLLENIKTIDISHNLLKTLPAYLASAEILRVLYVGHNRLESLPPWTSELRSIEIFSAKDNYLLGEPFEEDFCENAKETLKILELGGNFIEFLPTTLGRLSKVEFFHIGSTMPEIGRCNFQNGNWILDLPGNFGGMVSLTKLRLDENQFERLPDSFGELANLEFFDVGQNRLAYLPDSFCNLRSLKTCMLSKNSLLELPADFGNLSQLTDLLLDSNQLKELPASLCKLTNLTTLDLFDNQLCNIPDCLPSLKRLKALNLDGNSLDGFDVPMISQANHYSANRKKFGPGSALAKDGTSALAIALQKKRALWAVHGETKQRESLQRSENNIVENGISSNGVNGSSNPEAADAGLVDRVRSGNGHLEEMGEEDWDRELEESSPYDDNQVYQHPESKGSPRGESAVNFYFLPSKEHAAEAPPAVFDADVQDGQFDDAD